MNLEEYKQKNDRNRHLTFPSGLEIDIVLPSPMDFLESGILDSENKTKMIETFLKSIKFPEGFSVDDLNLKDFSYLLEFVNNFFG